MKKTSLKNSGKNSPRLILNLFTVCPPPPPQRALYVGTTSKFSLKQRHDLISITFQRCSNVRCLRGQSFEKEDNVLNKPYKVDCLNA